MSLVKDIVVGLGVDAGDYFAKMKAAEKEMKDFEKAAKDAEKNVNKLDFTPATDSVGTFVKNLAMGGVAAVAAGAAIAGAFIADTIVEAVEASANLNEQMSKSEAIFGDSSSVISKDADELASKFGTLKTEFYSAASGIGQVAKGYGYTEAESARLATGLTKLAVDAEAFNDIPMAEAADLIKSALKGEYDSIDRIGVIMKAADVEAEGMRLGLGKLGKEMTNQELITARTSLITKGLADAQGAAAREAASASAMMRSVGNRWTNALAEMGKAIEPLTVAVLAFADDTIKSLGTALEENAEGFKEWSRVVIQTFKIVNQSWTTWISPIHAILAARAMFGEQVIGGAFKGLAADIGGVGAKKKPEKAKVDQKAEAAKVKAEAAKTKLAEDVKGFEKSMDAEINTYGKSGNAVELYKLKVQGATDAQLEHASSLVRITEALDKATKSREAAKEVVQANLTPLEKYNEEMKKLEGLKASGALGPEAFRRASLAAKKDLTGPEGPKLAKAMVSGSMEAYSAQAGFTAGKTQDEPMKELAKSNKQQVDLQTQIAQGINKLVDYGAEKLTAGVASLFTL